VHEDALRESSMPHPCVRELSSLAEPLGLCGHARGGAARPRRAPPTAARPTRAPDRAAAALHACGSTGMHMHASALRLRCGGVPCMLQAAARGLQGCWQRQASIRRAQFGGTTASTPGALIGCAAAACTTATAWQLRAPLPRRCAVTGVWRNDDCARARGLSCLQFVRPPGPLQRSESSSGAARGPPRRC
jgi:hypothetical protein